MSFTRLLSSRTLLSVRRLVLQPNITKYYSNDINFSDPRVQTYLRHLVIEYNDLHTKPRRNDEETYRLREIKPIVNALEERIFLYENIESLKELSKKETEDQEMKKMIKEEAQIYLKKLGEIDNDLQSVLLQPTLSQGGILLEVAAGAGGQEAMLFAAELFEMYCSYAKYKDWEVDIASIEKSDIGGVRKASMLIEGYGVPELMRVEAGVHRVQRIPTTERSGRIHTSTVSVAILSQPSEIELNLHDHDLEIETKRASGAGGQHVNTTDSAVRITHLPSGISVDCQEGRSQIKNKQIAVQKLRTLLLQQQCEHQTHKLNAERKSQVGSSERNEKVRTYNFPQDRVTEHRPGGSTTHNMKAFMGGGEQLEKIQLDILKHTRYEKVLKDIGESMAKLN